jgi:hypothetical protein
MAQALLFVAAVVGMLSLVPLATLLATGSMRAALEAARGYATVLGILAGASALFVAAAFIGSMP